jgi:hypothetical protein
VSTHAPTSLSWNRSQLAAQAQDLHVDAAIYLLVVQMGSGEQLLAA